VEWPPPTSSDYGTRVANAIHVTKTNPIPTLPEDV
jgi:hypothetical protein